MRIFNNLFFHYQIAELKGANQAALKTEVDHLLFLAYPSNEHLYAGTALLKISPVLTTKGHAHSKLDLPFYASHGVTPTIFPRTNTSSTQMIFDKIRLIFEEQKQVTH